MLKMHNLFDLNPTKPPLRVSYKQSLKNISDHAQITIKSAAASCFVITHT